MTAQLKIVNAKDANGPIGNSLAREDSRWDCGVGTRAKVARAHSRRSAEFRTMRKRSIRTAILLPFHSPVNFTSSLSLHHHATDELAYVLGKRWQSAA